jgi:RNA polymerase sigma-70 factor (ECF subfamily)
MLLGRQEADDAAQDVFIKAFNALHQYKRNVSFPAWLHRIASNHCLDILRKRKRQKTDSLDALIDSKGEPEAVAVPQANHEGVSEETAMAMNVLGTLSEDQRQILILRELDGLRYDEISVVMHCSLDAVKARLRRARIQLQEKARHFLTERSLTK